MTIPQYGPKLLSPFQPPHYQREVKIDAPEKTFSRVWTSSGYKPVFVHDLYTIIGAPFFEYAEKQNWSFGGIKRQYLLRIVALVEDITAKIGAFTGVVIEWNRFRTFYSPPTGEKQIVFQNATGERYSVSYKILEYGLVASNEIGIIKTRSLAAPPFPKLSQLMQREIDQTASLGECFFHQGSGEKITQRFDALFNDVKGEEELDFNGAYLTEQGIEFFRTQQETKCLVFSGYCILRGGFGCKITKISSSEAINHSPQVTHQVELNFTGHPLFPCLNEAAGYDKISSTSDIWSILGNPFFDWVDNERKHWSEETKKLQHTKRVLALIEDIENLNQQNPFTGVKISSEKLEFYGAPDRSVEIRLQDYRGNLFVLHEQQKRTPSDIPTISINAIAEKRLYTLSAKDMDRNWGLKDYFGAIYLLTGSPARLPGVMERLRRVGLTAPMLMMQDWEGGDYEVFQGVDASTVPEEHWSRMDNWGYGDSPQANRARTACFMAHRNIILHANECFKTALSALTEAKESGVGNLSALEDKVKKYSSILIFEDNNGFGIIEEDKVNVRSERVGAIFNQAMKELPEDWDMFFLMAWNTHPKEPIYVSSHIKKLFKGIVAKSYAVKHTAYEPLLSAMEVVVNKDDGILRPVDHVIGDLHEQRLNAYVISPAVCYRHDSTSLVFSDAQGQQGTHWQISY